MAHTPGPWTSVDQWAEHVAYRDADGDLIALAKRTSAGTREDITLMAAAPDLLAAAELALDFETLNTPEFVAKHGYKSGGDVQRALQAAITKAKGA